MISVICVWNNAEQYQNILIHSLNILENQEIAYGEFSSCANCKIVF